MPFEQDGRQLLAKLDEQKTIFDAQDARYAAAKASGADEETATKALRPTDDEKTRLKVLDDAIVEINKRIEDTKDGDAMRSRNEAYRKGLTAPVHTPDFGNGDLKGRDLEQLVKSVGEQFIERPEFKEWFKQVAPSGSFNDTSPMGNTCPPLQLEGKGLVVGASATSAGALVRRDYAGLVDFPFRPLVLRDVITIGRTGSDLIEYPRVTGYTSNAGMVAEATTTPTSFNQANNGLKPESSMTLEKVTTSVKTLAHWIPITRRAASDAPQIETLINNFLDFGLGELEETQIITGNGSGENFLGLDNTPNITLQAFDTDALTTTRKARTAAAVTGRARSTAFVMHPYDWEAFDLLKDAENRYYWGGPMVLGQKMLWGLPVVESEAMRLKTFYTGDLKQAILWDRESLTIRMSDAPNDFFLRNMFAILGEKRSAFGVFRPPAIVRGDLLAGPNS